LLNHIGNEYDSVLAADIVGKDAGAAKANLQIGKAYWGLHLGERIATTIFMYSFLGGGGESGATVGEIKRQNMTRGVPVSLVAEVLQKLSGRLLFYLHESNGRYYFTTTANLNRALTVRMENVSAEDLLSAERSLLGQQIKSSTMKTYLWPENPADIPDTSSPKLVILRTADQPLMERFLTEKGQTPRVHRNTLFFLTPLPVERPPFENLLRRSLATESLLADQTLSLTVAQHQDLQKQAKQAQSDLKDHIGRLYRQLFVPVQSGLQQIDMGIPTYGRNRHLDEEVYAKLHDDGRILERLAPLVIKERFLKNQDTVLTQQLVESGSRTPGAVLVTSAHVWETSIAEGVRKGLFGLGELDANEQPICHFYQEEPSISLQGQEVLIRADICAAQRAARTQPPYMPPPRVTSPGKVSDGGIAPPTSPTPTQPGRYSLRLRFRVPRGQVSNVMGLFNLLQQRFGQMDIDIRLTDGQISEQEIEDAVRETFRQIGVEAEIE